MDVKEAFFVTSSVEGMIEKVSSINPDTIIIIKSTIPVDSTEEVRKNLK